MSMHNEVRAVGRRKPPMIAWGACEMVIHFRAPAAAGGALVQAACGVPAKRLGVLHIAVHRCRHDASGAAGTGLQLCHSVVDICCLLF